MEKIKVLHAYLLSALTRHLQHQCSSSGLGLGLQAGSQTPPALSCSACLLPSHLLEAPAGRKTEMGWMLLSETVELLWRLARGTKSSEQLLRRQQALGVGSISPL